MKDFIKLLWKIIKGSKSLLEIEGIDTNITREEIVDSIRESREDRY